MGKNVESDEKSVRINDKEKQKDQMNDTAEKMVYWMK